jgi:DNA-binding NarL/FixJ family response regulator
MVQTQVSGETTSSNAPSDITRVVVCDQRKLHRQALSLWLRAQPGFELAGSGLSLAAITQICETERADAAIVCLSQESEVDTFFLEARTLTSRLPGLRLVVVTEFPVVSPQPYLEQGVHGLVSATAGTSGLMQALLARAPSALTVPPEQVVADPGPLTPRETEVLSLVGQGSTMEDISEELGISPSTVASHKERIFDKLDANNQAHAVARAIDLGIMPTGAIDLTQEDASEQQDR